MKKIKYITLILLGILCITCNQRKEDPTMPATMTDTIVTENEQAKEVNEQLDDTIHLNFIDEKGVFTAEGTIDSIHPRIYVKFINDDLGKLTASIIPTSGKGNIRFNQIIFPDQTSDGPFGMDLELPLKQTGKHLLVIGHSLMADNPYNGKFEVKLQIIGE